MKYKSAFILSLFLIFAALSTVSMGASKVDPALQEKISQGQSDYQRIIIRLADRYDKVRLNEKLSLSSYTRQASHALVMETLKEHARTTQAHLVDYLSNEEASMNVRAFKAYWIDNLIWADIKTELIDSIAAFPEVDMIFPEVEITTILPVEEPRPLAQPLGIVPDNLKAIGADSAWKMGYTGTGTVVCTFDTGIEGTHPALVGQYRGTAGYAHDQCWFDPIDGDTFPHTFDQVVSTRRPHGTETMGVIVGKDDTTGDTVGVAFGAQWISAGVIDVPNIQPVDQFYLFDAFQWAADPDGNPNTIEDVPDVLSNSWGYPDSKIGCAELFYAVIDNLESLGIAVAFSAGNDGGYRTLRNPGNRATSPYNSFAVGMTNNDYGDLQVDVVSSKGPSPCDPSIIKPNVVAPGRSIYTTLPPNGFTTSATGTSFSCPHVAGALLILREYNQNAPVDSLKKALMVTAADLGETGPDSAAGYGLINIPAAMEYLGQTNKPRIEVVSVNDDTFPAAYTAEFYVTLKNSGLGVLNVLGTLRTSSQYADLMDSTADFGDIALNETANNIAAPFKVHFVSGIEQGTDIEIDLVITGSDSYSKTLPLHCTIGQAQERQLYDLDAGAFAFTISNFGMYGLAPGSIYDFGGLGFKYPQANANNLFQMGLLISTDSNHISNSVHDVVGIPEKQFKVAPDGEFAVETSTGNFAQKTTSYFTDENAPDPIGIRVKQETYAYDTEIEGHFTLLVYTLENMTESPLEDVKFSIFSDWDFPGSPDRVSFDLASGTGFMWAQLGGDYRAFTVLNDEGVSTFSSIPSASIYSDSVFTLAKKWRYITQGFADTASEYASDFSNMITTGPFTILPGETDTAAFALIASSSLDDLLTLYVPYARQAYEGTVPVDTTPPVMTINLLLNPVLPDQLDIYSHSSEELRLDPELTVVSPSQTRVYSMVPLSDHDILTYIKHYTITESGLFTVTVCGSDFSDNDSCTDVTFTASPAAEKQRTILASPAHQFVLDIPPEALNRDGLIIMQEYNPAKADSYSGILPNNFKPLRGLEMKSQANLRNSSANLEIDLDKINGYNPGQYCLALARVEDNGNIEIVGIQSNLARDQMDVEISKFGKYIVGTISTGNGGPSVPTAYDLRQNVPNPFNAETMISFSLPENSRVKVEIYNILGQKVNLLADQEFSAGTHSLFWNGRNNAGNDVSTGIYFYRLQTEKFTQTRRMLLLK